MSAASIEPNSSSSWLTVDQPGFAFPSDLRTPNANVTLVETRLLVHFDDGWQAFPYIWKP